MADVALRSGAWQRPVQVGKSGALPGCSRSKMENSEDYREHRVTRDSDSGC